jgi:hypothetical protein
VLGALLHALAAAFTRPTYERFLVLLLAAILTPAAAPSSTCCAPSIPSPRDIPPRPGHPPKLTAAQKRLIPEFLWHGAEAYGFRGEVWTCARIAQVIEEEFGVRYHKDHVGRLLRAL